MDLQVTCNQYNLLNETQISRETMKKSSHNMNPPLALPVILTCLPLRLGTDVL